MKKLILFETFLAQAIFLIHDILKKDPKMTGAKKLIEVKNKLFHAHLPCEGIFEIIHTEALFS